MKKTLILICCLILSTSLSGCKSDEDNSEAEVTDISLEEVQLSNLSEPIEFKDIDFTDPSSVANGFLNLIWQDNMTDAYKCLKIDDDTFNTVEDFDYLMHASKFASIIGNEDYVLPEIEIKVDGTRGVYYFYPDENNTDNYEIINVLRLDNNEWKVETAYWYTNIYGCYVPSGVRLYINNAEVTENYKVEERDGLDLYQVPFLPSRTLETKIVSSTFGAISGQIEVLHYQPGKEANNKKLDYWNEIPKELSNEMFDEVAESVGNIYNQVFKAMENNAESTTLSEFICSDKNYKFFEKYYNSGLNTRNSYYNSIENKSNIKDVEILEITSNKNAISYVYDNKTVVLNMNFKIHWINGSTPCEENISGAAKVSYENGLWKLNDITPNVWTTLQDGYNDTNTSLYSWKNSNTINNN